MLLVYTPSLVGVCCTSLSLPNLSYTSATSTLDVTLRSLDSVLLVFIDAIISVNLT